jgi:carbon-monoxide dehydrogenase iron sulfur subunit
MKRILARKEVCVGCHLCEVHCAVAHSHSKAIVKAFKEEFPRAKSAVKVEDAGCASMALQCRHCAEPHCIQACMTGAMHRDEAAGAVVCDTTQCVGCWMCVMACPYGAIQRDVEGKGTVSKCDLCAEFGEPACVTNCPNEALILVEVEEEEAQSV